VKAYPNLTHEQREPILVAAFSRGLADKGLATYLATMNPKTSAKAERVALAGSAMRSEFKGRRSTGTYYSGEVNSNGEEEDEQNSDSEADSQEEYEIAAAAPEQRPRGKPFGRSGTDRRRTGNRRGCFNCGASDHFRADCPKCKPKRTLPSACDICDGAHYLRQCPKWEALKQIGRKMPASQPNTSAAGGAKGNRSDTNNSRVPESEVTMVVMADVATQNTGADVACPAEDFDETPRLKLFFVSASVQTMPV
jgi:hypothetical protein